MRNVVDSQGFNSFWDETQEQLSVDQPAYFSKGVEMQSLTASIASTQRQIWVDLSGDDTHGSGSFTRPYRTIERALSASYVASPIPHVDSPMCINVGAGVYHEKQLNVPSYVSINGAGNSTTRIRAATSGSVIFNAYGDRVRINNLTVWGYSTGSSGETGIKCDNPGVTYRNSPRMWDIVVTNCAKGVLVTSASAGVCFEVKSYDTKQAFVSENGSEFDLYQCYAYQLVDPNASGTIGASITADSSNSYVYLFAFNTWGNEIAMCADGTGPSKGGQIYGQNVAMESETVGLCCRRAAQINLSDVWSKNVISYDISQASVDSVISLRNAQIDYSKLNLIVGGEANVKMSGVDVNDVDIMRLRGPEPAIQFRNLNTGVTAGGLVRVALEDAHLCIERNTHVSGTFATKVEDFKIDNTGSVAVGEIATGWNKLDVSGSIGARNGGAIRMYEATENGNSFFGFRASASMAASTEYQMPDAFPPALRYLVCDANGYFGWAAATATGEANTGENLQSDFGIYASKSGVALQFKALVAGPNITLTSGSSTITISASATGEANTGENLQSDFGVYSGKSGVALQFKALVAGGGITLTSASNTITIAASGSGEVITAANVGTGTGVFKQKSVSELQFYSLSGPTGSLGACLTASLSGNDLHVTQRSLARTLVLEDDFVANTAAGNLGWQSTVNGLGASTSVSAYGIDVAPLASNAIGVVDLSIGTNATQGRAALHSYVSAFRLDVFASTVMEWRVTVDVLSAATQEYRLYFGWIDSVAAIGDQTDGVYFMYDRATAGDFWRICTAAAGTSTKTTTLTAVTAATFARFRIETNLSNTSAKYYINDVLVGTISTNLPVGAGRSLGYGIKMERLAGTTARHTYVDYMQLIADWAAGAR